MDKLNYSEIPEGASKEILDQHIMQFIKEKEELLKNDGIVKTLEKLKYIAEKYSSGNYVLDKQSIKMLSTFLLEVLDFNNIQILDSIIFISSNLLLSKVMRRIINQTNIQNKEILAIIEEAKMEWIYGIKESKKLLEKIHKCNFNGEFELDNYGVIVWYLSENIWLEIVKGGHGGDDLIIVKFKAPTGKVHQDFDCLFTNTDEELIEELKKFDDGKFTVTEKKGWFKNKYKFNYRNWC